MSSTVNCVALTYHKTFTVRIQGTTNSTFNICAYNNDAATHEFKFFAWLTNGYAAF